MKILFISGIYVPASGGSEISAHTLLAELISRKHKIQVITGLNDFRKIKKETISGVSILRTTERKLKQTVHKYFKSFQPDIVLTQLMWSEKILMWAKKENFLTGYFIRSIGNKLDLTKKSNRSPDIIFANSPITQQFVAEEWKRKSLLVYPIVKINDYIADQPGDRHYITMFNPIKIKGGKIFEKIALKMPLKKFMAVEGWHHWKNKKTGKWDINKLKSNAKAFNSAVIIPEEISFKNIKNVKFQPATQDVKSIYKKTKILLVPSLWQEPSARVIIEAMSNGIPVIVSNTGASVKMVGRGGLVVKKYLDPTEWTKKIDYLLNDKNKYESLSMCAKKHVLKFNYKKEVTKVEKALMKAISAKRRSSKQ